MKPHFRALGAALFGCLVLAAPANAGQLVFNAGDEIHVANDDGSNQQVLIRPADVPGAVSVYYPWIQPGGGDLLFSARTPYGGYNGLYCGFHCVGVYKLDRAGAITRISGEPTNYPAGDPSSGFDTDAKLTIDGQFFFYEQSYVEPNGGGGISGIEESFFAPAVPGGTGQGQALTGECARPDNYVPSPVDNGDYLYVDCVGGSNFDSAIKRGDGAQLIASDSDGQITDLAWRGDGAVIADTEQGSDPGIWTIDLGTSTPQHVVNLPWDGDHYAFATSPAFIGNDRIAFVYGNEIRSVPTSCNGCGVGDTTLLLNAEDAKGLAWTTGTVPAVKRPDTGNGNPQGGTGNPHGGNGNPQGGTGNPQGGNGQPNGNGGGAVQAGLTPKAAKLTAALKSGLAVPFTANAPGALTLNATIDAKTAKKLKLIKKGSKPVTIASGKTTLKSAGTGNAKLKFKEAFVKKLGKAKSIKLKLSGTFAPTSGASQKVSASVTLKR